MKDLPTHMSFGYPRVVVRDGVVYMTTPSRMEISQKNPSCKNKNFFNVTNKNRTNNYDQFLTTLCLYVCMCFYGSMTMLTSRWRWWEIIQRLHIVATFSTTSANGSHKCVVSYLRLGYDVFSMLVQHIVWQK